MKSTKKKKRFKRSIIALVILVFLAVAAVLYAPDLAERGYEWMYPLNYKSDVLEYSEQYDLDPYMVFALIRTESSFDPSAVSSAGAIGLAQIMPDTGQWLADKMQLELYSEEMLYIPTTNIEISCYYIDLLVGRFGDTDTALAAYNAGIGNVSAWLEDSQYSDDGITLKYIPFDETRDYVERINSAMGYYMEIYPELT